MTQLVQSLHQQKKYIKHFIDSHEKMYGEKLSTSVYSSLEKGSLQWIISHQLFDIVIVVLSIDYVDTNLFHNALTSRPVTGILHIINSTQIGWFSKKQATVEMQHTDQSLLQPKHVLSKL